MNKTTRLEARTPYIVCRSLVQSRGRACAASSGEKLARWTPNTRHIQAALGLGLPSCGSSLVIPCNSGFRDTKHPAYAPCSIHVLRDLIVRTRHTCYIFPMTIVRKAEGFVNEFWKFAAKGNMFDLAIGVILGTSFGAIVNSLVGDILMPLLSVFTGNINFADLAYTVRPATDSLPEASIRYGRLIQASVNFLVIGLSIFVFYKLFAKVRARLEWRERAEPPTAVSTEEKLLEEIRDILKRQDKPSEQ